VACLLLSLAHLGVSSVIIQEVALLPPGATPTLADQFATLLAGYLLMEFLVYGAALFAYGFVESRSRIRAVEAEQVRLQLAAVSAEADRARLEGLVSQARLRALRSELDPHFLFNSLNSVAALARRGDTDGTLSMLSRLGELLRITVDEDRDDEVSVAEEIALLELYLQIEEVRFGDRLTTCVRVDPDVRRARVPALILQPLVENAIRHGVSTVRRPVHVHVSATADHGALRLVVRDSGPGADAARLTPGATGLGLRNVRDRLELLGDPNTRLELREPPGGGMEAVVTLPLRLPEPVEVAP
jgi:LytS/YehU family sensor histidine kinase